MKALQLYPGEVLIGQGPMAYWEYICYFNWRSNGGTIYVTNRRVCFHIYLNSGLDIDLNLSDIDGFEVGKRCFFVTEVTIYTNADESFSFTGFPVRKLQRWLTEAGVRRFQREKKRKWL